MFVQRGPRSQVTPAKISRQTEDIGLPLAFGRSPLKHGIVNAYVFAPWVQATEKFRELSCAECCRNSFKHHCRLGQVLVQGVGQRAGAPQEHSTVPEIVPGLQESSGPLGIGLLGEAANSQPVTAGQSRFRYIRNRSRLAWGEFPARRCFRPRWQYGFLSPKPGDIVFRLRSRGRRETCR